MNSTALHRQLDIINPDLLDKPVTVIGAGGIGSITTLLLAKMGMTNITVWDDDVVEDHNIPNQMYPLNSIEKTKVEALYDTVKAFSGCEVLAVPSKFDFRTVKGILIVTVDNMATRKDIFESIRGRVDPELLIDARMGAESFRVYTFRPFESESCTKYEKSLYSDSEAIQEACTAKAIIYNTAFIGSIICSRVKNYLVGDNAKNKVEVIGEITTLDMI